MALKARTNRQGRSSVSGVKSLLWLLSAVSEVKTVEQQKKKEKIRLGNSAGHSVLQLYLMKKKCCIDHTVGNSSKHPVKLKGQGAPCAGLIEGFLF